MSPFLFSLFRLARFDQRKTAACLFVPAFFCRRRRQGIMMTEVTAPPPAQRAACYFARPVRSIVVMPPSTLPFRRIAGVVGLLAAVGCGWQLWWLVMWGVWGAPPNPLHPIALLGALALLVTSIVLLSTSGRKAAVVALLSTIPVWIFYAPACASSIFEVLNGSSRFTLVPFLPPILLLGATGFAALAIWRHNPSLQWTGAAARGFEVQEVPGRGPGH